MSKGDKDYYKRIKRRIWWDDNMPFFVVCGTILLFLIIFYLVLK